MTMYDYDYALPIPPQRRDSLSKATRDLMALELPPNNNNKRSSPPPQSASSSRPPSAVDVPPNHLKPTLSPSQKKANHIQSEQKRRANIRRGYEALCDVVPSLREALAQQEAPLSEPRKRRRTTNGNAGAGTGDDKSDGRAGPKSENVVLGKTIEYIHGLLAETEALKLRLAAAEPPDRDRDPSQGPRLWERKWEGGHKRDDEDAEDSDD